MPENSLAHYEILALLGRGGMGEVHRARDTKLGREVALKILPADFAADPERLARFRREAKVLASLHHPNIAGIFGIEEADGRVFLVMELAEGSDLSARIAQGPVPEEEALDIARQLAAGLEEAHEKGVVHRDLKPANIKLGSDGKVRILDFGLARAFAGETAAEEHLENSPTITAAMSRGGVILGTAAYMSPEQARGRKVDRRADIWAFGVVLFEMLTGKRLFEGETISDTLAAVLRAEIDWDRLPEATSPGMRRLLERCLERDPLRRLRDIGEARVFLESGAVDSSLLGSSSSMIAGGLGDLAEEGGRRGVPVWAMIAVAAVVAVAGLLVGWKVLGRPQPPPLLNMAIPAPAGGAFNVLTSGPGPAALSPDGTMVAYSVRDEAGKVSLHLRHLDRPEGTALAGTDGAVYPFWSPDSRYIGFGSGDRKLKKVAVTGGPPITLCAADNPKGGTWNRDGTILFAPTHNSGIFRVSASGGEPVQVTTIDADNNENSHRHPRFLPDGKHFLFLARLNGSGTGDNRIYLGSLDGDEPRVLTVSETAAEYSAGHLLTSREGILLATPFDPGAGKLGENSVPLVENILIPSGGSGCGVYSPTPDGMLLYQISTGQSEHSLTWSGPAGDRLGPVGEPGNMTRPRISPDGAQAVVEILDPEMETSDLWLVNLDSGLRSRLTFDPGDENYAIWTPDGSAIVYVAEADSIRRVVMQPVEGAGGATILFEAKRDIVPSAVSADGRTIFVCRDDPETEWNLYTLSVETGELSPEIETPDSEFWEVPSPDGRWTAYTRYSAKGFEVLVRQAAGGERRWQVDKSGGLYPFWAPDGKTLFYCGSTEGVYAVPVDGGGTTFRAGAPELFAKAPVPTSGGPGVSLHPDGDRILSVSGETSDSETGYLQLVTDWRRGLAN